MLAALLSLVAAAPAMAQTYDVSWFSVYGVGASSAGGAFVLAGTAGQPDAGGPFAGGSFSVYGGFWSAAAAGVRPGGFHSLTPCRAVDTRGNGAPIQGGALVSGIPRALPLGGVCGVPLTATAVSLNLTVTQATGAGFLVAYPWDRGAPGTSALSFSTSGARANNAVLALAFDGSGRLGAVATITGGGSLHLIVDVNGYFE